MHEHCVHGNEYMSLLLWLYHVIFELDIYFEAHNLMFAVTSCRPFQYCRKLAVILPVFKIPITLNLLCLKKS